MRKAVPSLAAVILLGGCASAHDFMEGKDRIDYRSATTLPSLEIPPDLTSPARDNRYVVPETGKSSATFSGYQAERGGPRPGTSTVLPEVEHMKIERAGTQRWLVVHDAPEKLWPLVKDFWQENGFLIKLEVPEAGVMETEWNENRAKLPQDFIRDMLGKVLDTLYSTSERDKFRTRLERSQDGKGTEIYISHRGMQEVYNSRDPQSTTTGSTIWTSRPSDPELEAEFLRRLMVRLGAQEQQARAIGAAEALVLRAELKKGVDGELLQVHEPFDRAWRRVGLALDRVGFTVEDRDRQKGMYFVRYADPESDSAPSRGFLGRLLSLGQNDNRVKAEQFRVQVRQAGTSSEVNVLNKDGASDSSRTAQRILTLLHEQLK
ncbi:MAG: outer membrane protein assembly factor BamC [Betaproteobacteria bacterium]